jgi:hypothetical protein
MEAKNRTNILVWTIIVLVVLNMATIVTVVYNRNKFTGQEEVTIPDKTDSENASVKYSGRYFRDELNLDKEQMKRFSEFNPQFRQNVMAINRSLDAKRHDMLVEMADKNCDTTRLNRISDSIGFLHANLKKQTYMYYLNFKSICSEQQQKKLEQLFNEMFGSDIEMGQNGRAGRGGRRFGWRNNN